MLAEHLAISMDATFFFFLQIFIFAWQDMRSTAPTTKCRNTRLSQPPRVGLVSPALLCRPKQLLLSSVIVGEQALDINLVDGVEAVVFFGHARADAST